MNVKKVSEWHGMVSLEQTLLLSLEPMWNDQMLNGLE